MPESIPQGSQPGAHSPIIRRRYRNLLLKPGLQTMLGVYLVGLSLAFSVSVGAVMYLNFAELVDVVLAMTEAQDEVRDIFHSYWAGTQLYIYLIFFVYVIAAIGLTVWYTHHLVGPTIAFRRHIIALKDGDYMARTNLRKGDAFEEVAFALNALSESLEQDGRKP